MMFYAITGGFILFDFITGLLKSFKEKNYSSSIMRQGLFNKIGFVLCVVLGYLVDYAQNFIDLGVSIPLSKIICTYIILTEIGSIIENLALLNDKIIPEKLLSFFKNRGDKND